MRGTTTVRGLSSEYLGWNKIMTKMEIESGVMSGNSSLVRVATKVVELN